MPSTRHGANTVHRWIASVSAVLRRRPRRRRMRRQGKRGCRQRARSDAVGLARADSEMPCALRPSSRRFWHRLRMPRCRTPSREPLVHRRPCRICAWTHSPSSTSTMAMWLTRHVFTLAASTLTCGAKRSETSLRGATCCTRSSLDASPKSYRTKRRISVLLSTTCTSTWLVTRRF